MRNFIKKIVKEALREYFDERDLMILKSIKKINNIHLRKSRKDISNLYKQAKKILK